MAIIKYISASIWVFLLLHSHCFTIGQSTFQYNGAASPLDEQCYSLEIDGGFVGGTVFTQNHIDMSIPRIFNSRISTSCFDEDGDGLVFVFQPLGSFAGSYMETLGYRWLSPSLGIEIDLDPNPEDNDPTYDHLAIILDGDLNHLSENNLAGPVRLLPGQDDIEDCRDHFLTVEWLPESRTLNIYFDCQLRLSLQRDFNIFTLVGIHWGITGGLKGEGQQYSVCPDYREKLPNTPESNICQGDEIELISSRNASQFEWRAGSELLEEEGNILSIAPDTSTVFSVLTTDDCSRKFVEEFVVNVLEENFIIDIGPADTVICQGETVILSVSDQEGDYFWNNGETGASIEVDDPGIYSVTGHKGGCTAKDSITVVAGELPLLNIGDDVEICEGEIYNLQVDLGDHLEYVWNQGEFFGNTIQLDEPGPLVLTIGNRCGEMTDEIYVSTVNCFPVYIPNVFSPNDDGINDRVEVQSEIDGVIVQAFHIYDRWGNLVYVVENQNINLGVFWDGRSNGNFLDIGVYSFHISIRLPAGKISEGSGTITLVH